MKEAIGAYRHVTATDEFRKLERMRSYARHNEASAIGHAVDMERKNGKEWPPRTWNCGRESRN